MVQAGGEPRTRSKVKTTQAGILRALLARPLALIFDGVPCASGTRWKASASSR